MFRILSLALAFSMLGWVVDSAAQVAPPQDRQDNADADQAPTDAPRGKPNVRRQPGPRPNAANDNDDKKVAKNAAGSLAERRAAAAREKVAVAAKRLFPRFDANRDKVLDDAEWTRAKAAIDKMIDAEVLKTSGARRELVRDALTNMQRPDVQRNGTDIGPEAAEQYARDLLTAATEAADKAQPTAVPMPPPQAGRRAGSNSGDDPRRGRIERPLPRGNATDAERAREEALRRRGLREENGRIVPIVPGRQGGNAPGGRPNAPGGGRP